MEPGRRKRLTVASFEAIRARRQRRRFHVKTPVLDGGRLRGRTPSGRTTAPRAVDLERSSIRPPISSASSRAIARPRPLPDARVPVEPVEALEDVPRVLRGDSRPVVLDLEARLGVR